MGGISYPSTLDPKLIPSVHLGVLAQSGHEVVVWDEADELERVSALLDNDQYYQQDSHLRGVSNDQRRLTRTFHAMIPKDKLGTADVDKRFGAKITKGCQGACGAPCLNESSALKCGVASLDKVRGLTVGDSCFICVPTFLRHLSAAVRDL